jgi:hypothetical protein
MVTHIVMFKLKPDCPPGTVEDLKARLLSLKDKIGTIRKWEVGINVGASSKPYDLVVYSTFDTMEDVAAFRVNPDHVAVATYVRGFVETSGTVDYVND